MEELLSRKENIFLAKKTLVGNIYNSAKLEGCNVTYPNTKTILDGISVGNLKIEDVEVVLNLRDAWKYLLEQNNIDQKITIEYICKINSYISRNESIEWGVLRSGKIGISGTDYIPEIPEYKEMEVELKELLKVKSIVERAMKIFLWGCKRQLFWDGNKRTSTLIANKILIANGKGIFSIPETKLSQFNTKLSKDAPVCVAASFIA